MALTVKQLIKELKKWPPNYSVATAFDDNEGNEIQWYIHSLIELEEGDEKTANGPAVVLRS